MQQKKGQQGFSLIELLIVVAIIGIIAAIAVPNLLRSRQAANESSAIANLRSITTAQQIYIQGTGGGTLYGSAAQLRDNYLIDSALAGIGAGSTGGTKSGYAYVITPHNTNPTFITTAAAQSSAGTRSFFSNETGVIRALAGAIPPTATTGTPIQ